MPESEYRERLARIASSMARAELDALIAYSSRSIAGMVRYLTGYEPWQVPEDTAIAVFTPGRAQDIALMTNCHWDFWDFNRANSTWVSDVVVGLDWAHEISIRLGSDVKSVGIAGWRAFPAYLLDDLRDRHPGATFVDATALLRNERSLKSPAELDALAEVGRVADAGGRAFIEAVVTGASERDVASSVDMALMLHGSEQLGYFSNVGSGPRTVASCFLPTDRVLADGDLVQLDCAPMVDGYKADFSRVAVAGGAKGRALHLMETLAEAYDECALTLRAGVACSDVALTGWNVLQRQGYDRDNLYPLLSPKGAIFMGHGIGLENPDPPGMLTLDNHTPLEPNMVINLEPVILDPGVGAGRIEGAFVITEGAPVPLSTCDIRPWLREAAEGAGLAPARRDL